MATPPAPLPPAVTQQESPGGQQSAFLANGIGQPQEGMQPIQDALASIKKISQELDDLNSTIMQVHPPLRFYLGPVAKGLMELRTKLAEFAQRSGMAQGSPVMPQPPETNPTGAPSGPETN